MKGILPLIGLALVIFVVVVGLGAAKALYEALTPSVLKVIGGVALTLFIFITVMVINTAENYLTLLAASRSEQRLMDKVQMILATVTAGRALSAPTMMTPGSMDPATLLAWMQEHGGQPPATMIMQPQGQGLLGRANDVTVE